MFIIHQVHNILISDMKYFDVNGNYSNIVGVIVYDFGLCVERTLTA